MNSWVQPCTLFYDLYFHLYIVSSLPQRYLDRSFSQYLCHAHQGNPVASVGKILQGFLAMTRNMTVIDTAQLNLKSQDESLSVVAKKRRIYRPSPEEHDEKLQM